MSRFWTLIFLPCKEIQHVYSYLCFFPPARIRWIWSPLLKAWLNSNRVWNSETNGNQASTATGAKRTNPIMYSYPLARALTDPHIPKPLTNGLHDCDICKLKEGRIKKLVNNNSNVGQKVKMRWVCLVSSFFKFLVSKKKLKKKKKTLDSFGR